jgi:hypothetical protein
LRFCLLFVLFSLNGLPFCFVLLFHSFFCGFFIVWVISSLILSNFTLNSFIYLFMVFSVSVWCLFRAPMISFIVSVFSHILYFCCLGISWVPSVCFGWPCLVTSLWNFINYL